MPDRPATTGRAFGAPGMAPKWTSSSKDGIGTAYSAASTVWFTVSHGILNEIYYPTVDRPQVRDMQFLVADGAGLFHEERRDLRTEIRCVEPYVLGHHIENSDPAGRYRIVKEIIADPHQACVLVNARLEGDAELLRRLQVYALLAPHLEVGGWGNSARVVPLGASKIVVAWKGATWLAMGADVGFQRASCGYVAASDGWQDLHDNGRMDWEFDEARDGNIGVMGQIDLRRQPEFTVGIAFGDSMHAAVTKLAQSLAVPFATHRERYVEQWRRACSNRLPLEGASQDDGLMYSISRNLLLAHEDKTFAGAIVASASIPWGDAKGDEDLGGYHLVWTRDLVQSATALLASGDAHTPLRALVYLACTQGDDGGFAQNFWIDGRPYLNGVQLDEVAFPVTLAWRLWKANALQQFDPYPMVVAAARFLVRRGPASEQERWEECAGYSPSTLAITIAALVCAAEFATSRGDAELAAFLLDYADFLESHVERWTVTTRGVLVPGIERHYIRVTPVHPDDPSPNEDPNAGSVILNNQPPGAPWQYPANLIVDAGFLELVRYGVRLPNDPLVEDSLRVVDAVLKVNTPFGPCWRRYNHDGYGSRPDGGPYEGWGQGRAWPLLVGERAHYELACGRNVDDLVRAMERFASKGGMLPEQVWDQDVRGAGTCLGRPAGSAMPLMWAHAEYVKLLRSIEDARVVDLIEPVAARYRCGLGRRDLEIWKLNRQVRSVAPGQVLRVQAPAAFELEWSLDGGTSSVPTPSTPTTIGVQFADIEVPANQQAPVRFRIRGAVDGVIEPSDYEVGIERQSIVDSR